MTLDEILTATHTIYEADASPPTSGDDAYTLRTRLANAAVNRWEHEDGMLWDELWVKLSDAADGDSTTVDGTLIYDCPSDFRFPGSYVRLVDGDGGSTYYSVVKSSDFQLWDNEDKNVCTFTGNEQDGYDLEFLDDPDGAYTIKYEYYKTADALSDPTDTPELRDAYFIVYFIVSRLYEADNRMGQAQKAFQESESRLSQMRARNLQIGPWQDNRVRDWSFAQGVGGFGV